MTKIGRNESCPCGSGMKYKKCCINTGAFKEIPDLLKQINDYGIPKINNSFFKNNPVEKISAFNICYSNVFQFEPEKLQEMTLGILKKTDEKRYNEISFEKQKLQKINDSKQILHYLDNLPEKSNVPLLVDKIIQYLPDHKNIILKKLNHSFDDSFVELVILYINKFKIQFQSEWSEDLLKLVKKPILNIYACALLCMVIGILKIEKTEKLLWDCFHEFKKTFPNKNYHQGPLIGLYELNGM